MPVLYPHKIVPSDVIPQAQRFSDIAHDVTTELIDTTSICMTYSNDQFVIKLGYCDFWHCSPYVFVDGFYTANFRGAEKDSDISCRDIHLLQKPLPGIGVALFSKLLDFCHAHGVHRIVLLPLQKTKSVYFYQQLPMYFPNVISAVSLMDIWSILVDLK